MNKAKTLKIIYGQLQELFASLEKKINYRGEIIKDYHSIISNLEGLLSLENLDDFKIPGSALIGGVFQLSPFDGEQYFNGQIVRSKMCQLLSVIKAEISTLQKEKEKYSQQPEVTLRNLIRKEFKKSLAIIDNLRREIEENVLSKVLISIGAIAAGIIIIYHLIKFAIRLFTG